MRQIIKKPPIKIESNGYDWVEVVFENKLEFSAGFQESKFVFVYDKNDYPKKVISSTINDFFRKFLAIQKLNPIIWHFEEEQDAVKLKFANGFIASLEQKTDRFWLRTEYKHGDATYASTESGDFVTLMYKLFKNLYICDAWICMKQTEQSDDSNVQKLRTLVNDLYLSVRAMSYGDYDYDEEEEEE